MVTVLAGVLWLHAADSDPTGPAKPAELPTTGKNIARDNGGWFNIEATGQRMILRFFDAEKKPIAPDMLRGQVLFRYGGKKDARAPLNVEGMTLATPATIHPPHNYVVFLNFFADDGGEPSETYTFRYP